MYEYAASLLRVVDGDTVDFAIDLGFSIGVVQRVRLAGLNAPEVATTEGRAARDYACAWFAQHGIHVVVTTFKDHREKYGRLLADVVATDGANLNADLLAGGHAVPYAGGAR